MANFCIIYKSSWEYSQALDNDHLQGLVAKAVSSTLWLGPTTCFQPGAGHNWAVSTEETSPGSPGKEYEWLSVTLTHSFEDSLPVKSTRSHGVHPETLT